MSPPGSKIHERLAHFFIDIYTLLFRRIARQAHLWYDNTRMRGGAVMSLQIVRNDMVVSRIFRKLVCSRWSK